ncbi:hypothetical protein JOM56_002656 [Amanita muscaria]
MKDTSAASQLPNLEPVAPLQMSENRWDRRSFHNNDPDWPEVVDRKVKALLNKLTMENFDSISDQIIQWANRSENQKDGRTLAQVVRLVLGKATDEAMWSEMYARLCRKMLGLVGWTVSGSSLDVTGDDEEEGLSGTEVGLKEDGRDRGLITR